MRINYMCQMFQPFQIQLYLDIIHYYYFISSRGPTGQPQRSLAFDSWLLTSR